MSVKLTGSGSQLFNQLGVNFGERQEIKLFQLSLPNCVRDQGCLSIIWRRLLIGTLLLQVAGQLFGAKAGLVRIAERRNLTNKKAAAVSRSSLSVVL
jgi:hypothetical protein